MTNIIITLLTTSCLHGSIPDMVQYPERYADSSYSLYGDVKKKKKKGKKIGGSKGPALNFRPWNRQLRQTIMISSENWVTSIAPLEGFVHRDNNLDTIGMDAKTSKCNIN